MKQGPFTQCVSVWGVPIYATDAAPAEELTHAAHCLAQWLDNDEDGVPTAAVLEAMVRGDAAVIMGADAKETDRAGEWASENGLGQTQGCRVSETFPTNRGLAGETFDAGPLEEILHLVMDTGFGQVPARAIQAPGML
jgi:hypothetical protein